MSDLKLIHARHPPPHQDGWRRRGFDYSQVDADLAAQMRETASRIWRLTHNAFIQLGRELRTIKSRLERGQFVAWAETDCQLHIRTAQRAMQAADLLDENDKLSYLPLDGLLALASRSAPKLIVAEIIEQIETGAQPTAAEIKRRIAAARDEANTLLDGAQAPAEMRPPSPKAELVALIGSWDCAGREARQAFLDRIGAVLATAAQIEKAKQSPTASSEPPATVPARPGHGSLRTLASIVIKAAQQPTAAPEPSAAVQEQSDKDGIATMAQIEEAEQQWPALPHVPAVVPGEIGLQNVTPSQIGLAEHQLGSPDPIAAISGPRDTGGCAEIETASPHESWVGFAPPPGVACHTKNGVCRYDSCAASGLCRAASPAHEQAAA